MSELLLIHCATIDDSDSYVSEEEKEDEKKEDVKNMKDEPASVTSSAPTKPAVPLGADFGMCESE